TISHPLPSAGVPEIAYNGALITIFHFEQRFSVGIVEQPQPARRIIGKRNCPLHLPVGVVGGKRSFFFPIDILTAQDSPPSGIEIDKIALEFLLTEVECCHALKGFEWARLIGEVIVVVVEETHLSLRRRLVINRPVGSVCTSRLCCNGSG